MIQYPLTFEVQARSEAGVEKTWTTGAPSVSSAIPAAIPPEFKGPGGGYSPEDLYALALTNCFVATFKVFAQNSKLSYAAISVRTQLTVDRDEKGAPWMAKADFRIQLEGATDRDRAQRLLEKTSQSCLVLNSVKTQKTFEFQL